MKNKTFNTTFLRIKHVQLFLFIGTLFFFSFIFASTSKAAIYDMNLPYNQQTFQVRSLTHGPITSSQVYRLKIDENLIPDQNFRNYIIKDSDVVVAINPNDNFYYTNEMWIEHLSRIDAPGRHIKSLWGIQNFKYLTELNIENNELRSLDVSQNKNLLKLNASNNLLTQFLGYGPLDYPADPNYSYSSNILSGINSLNLSNNKLQKLDLSGLNTLSELSIFNNPNLSSINLSNVRFLFSLDLRGTSLEPGVAFDSPFCKYIK